MRFWTWLVIGAFVAACGEGEVGDECDENDDCEDGLVCVPSDPLNDDPEGTCEEATTGDDDDGGDTDTDAG